MTALAGWGSFLLTMGTFTCIWGLLALGLNIHYGFTGMLNFGHVAFFAAGAYSSAIVTMPPPEQIDGARYLFGFDLAMPLGFSVSLAVATLVGGLLALLIGLTSVRLGSHYLAIATFALAGIFDAMLINESWLTNGTFGMNSVPQPMRDTLGNDVWPVAYLAFTALCLLGVYLVVTKLLDAPFGRLLRGVREDEEAAKMLGKDTSKIKLKSFALGGAVAGLAGGLYAHFIGTVVTEQFVPDVTFVIWAAVLLGGVASSRGAVVGAFVVIAFQEFTRFISTFVGAVERLLPDMLSWTIPAIAAQLPNHPSFVPSVRFILIGLLFILVIRYRPEGLFGDPDEVTVMGEGE